MNLSFSIIVPVYNRPKEIDELLYSLTKQDFGDDYEVLIVEDGSDISSEDIIKKYASNLHLKYYYKENSGAGMSRNFGMERATGNYFIILDSDVILPTTYLSSVKNALIHNFTDAFGGPDKAHESFTPLQKAINYSMTSVFTTGGIRGKKKSVGKFQPRSFNMGISKEAFKKTKGFNHYKVGEDIDLSFRLWSEGYDTQLITEAYVYHKRRTSIKQFFKQTFSFGTARPELNRRFPSTKKITYWFPSLFIVGLDIFLVLALFGYWQFLLCYVAYFVVLFLDSLLQNKSFKVAYLSIVTTLTQFYGYGLGFLKSYFFKSS
ncbi:glycosyl transferase family 2 [Tenacibaculum skagerrakense]|uniref:Glycosyl transferase family 2 n=1 Tax=Tenacibaculum skagerrakense TaxID=186571 RepID=A0A4R2NVP3_9FLAO|nr:glycosyltransferase [Tenacibaculum skagerrakense]TCP25671.1 glycosyl transferase family 2 [Tenacibaculum skagerrakense]